MKQVIIYGLGDFANQMYYYLTQNAKRRVCAFAVDKKYISSERHFDLPVVEFENIEDYYPPYKYEMLIAIGYKSMRNREIMFDNAKSKGYNLINFIHTSALCDPSTVLGENNIILANVNIEPFVIIGENNIFWTDSLICHNVQIGSHNFFAAKSLVGGYSQIENNCFIGFNSTIKEKIVVKQSGLIAANSLILNNTQAFCKYKGVPGKLFGDRHEKNGIEIN